MSSIIEGYNYDIFISYRQKDNKGDKWVSEFVEALKTELESTFKEEISVYFDINPHDGLLETHDVDESLKEKLRCLVFIPIISRTYCDPKSFAWEHEFRAFVEQASKDQFGLKVKLPNGNVAGRVLPVQIHDLDANDKKLVESALGGFLRGIEFIYKEPGVNRPLRFNEENPHDNLNHTLYRNQINKVVLNVKDIILGIGASRSHQEEIKGKEEMVAEPGYREELKINELPPKKWGSKHKNLKEKRLPGSGRERVLFPGIILILIFLTIGILLINRHYRIKWATGKALTDPPGADVYIKEYSDINGKWEKIGRTPVNRIRMPGSQLFWAECSLYQLRIEKPGYEDILAVVASDEDTLSRILFREGAIPPDMVYVERLNGFFIDRYEVTNKQFKDFVGKGGYTNRDYWKNDFIKDSKTISRTDASYLYSYLSQLPSFDRSPKNGFRCAIYIDKEKIPESTFGKIDYNEVTDYSKVTPVDDRIFEVIKNQFLYDKTDLNVKKEQAESNSDDWIVEKITYNAAYGKERIISWLFLPRNSTPPFQTLIFFPGMGAINEKDLLKSTETKRLIDYILKSGRTVMCPVYKGTFERIDEQEPVLIQGRQVRDWIIRWVKDFQRSVDYLETRPDIDIEKLGYYGSSLGGAMGGVIPALEDRLKVNILIVGGLRGEEMVNFVPRVKIPTLMLNGRYDFTFPLENSVQPFFKFLGTPADDKKLVVYETDHYVPRNEMIKEVLAWCDKYLGPVKKER